MESKSKKRSFNTTFSNNDLHPLNPYYKNKSDFSKLASKYPDTFGIYVINNNNSNNSNSNNNNSIDWTNKDALISLSSTLLKEDFNLNLVLLPDRLCPPLPNRLNYLCWLSDIIKLHCIRKNNEINNNSNNSNNSNIHILDIGVGSSCIYPLLGYKQFGWKFTGSEIDKKSAENARKNVIINKNDIPEGFITIIEVKPSINIQELIYDQILSSLVNEKSMGKNVEIDNISNQFCSFMEDQQVVIEENEMKQLLNVSISIKDILLNNGNIDNPLRGPLRTSLMEMGVSTSAYILECEQSFFSNSIEVINSISNKGIEEDIVTACMTNPPFYSPEEIIYKNDNTICTGSQEEMLTIGGEVAFIAAIIADSVIIRDRIPCYTCMVGKKSSLVTLKQLLLETGSKINCSIKNYPEIFIVRFTQGKTMRWGLSWSWCQYRNDNCSYIYDNEYEILVNRSGLIGSSHKNELCSFSITIKDIINTSTSKELDLIPFHNESKQKKIIFEKILIRNRIELSLKNYFTIKQSSEFELNFSFIDHFDNDNMLNFEFILMINNINFIKIKLVCDAEDDVIENVKLISQIKESNIKISIKIIQHHKFLMDFVDNFKQNVFRINRKWRRYLSSN